eukprot:TRINITY_DN2833_c1_g1_i1.p1 TRINITY_DN2833_c1_g1~~TRINITY_DN2833_c1_g1_i1.p1  ORF type:complete len:107 (-),score=24.52 TRINITY_DN2833_c1_g1_i1:18-338(-)
MEKAEEIFKEMGTKDLVSYNTLLNIYATLGLTEKAESLFEEMKKQKSLSPDIVSYCVVIVMYMKKRSQSANAKRVYLEMLSKGISDSTLDPSLQQRLRRMTESKKE